MTEQIASPPNERARELAGKYLTFHLAGEEYGLEILTVREIIGMQPPTSVPQAPPHFKGVINLRGKVVPVVDLRTRFGLDEAEPTKLTAIIVTQVADAEIGVIVDRVCEVVDVAEVDIADTPALGAGVDTSFVTGLAKLDGRVTILLDIAHVLHADELAPEAALTE